MKILLFLFMCLFVYALIENIFILKIRREVFNSDKNALKIVHLSDLHKRKFGKNNSRLLEMVKSECPDVIIFSGDLITRYCSDFTSAGNFLKVLTSIAPVYYSYGNHELDLPETLFREFNSILNECGVRFVNNGTESIEFKGRKFNITSASLKKTIYKKNNSYKNLDGYTVEELENAVGKSEIGGINLLIAHNPLFADVYSEWGADYTFSGHIHGGAVVIPFTRIGLLSPERRFFPKYSKGVFEVGNMKLLVSGGLGKLRLFNPPEVVVYFI